jgi:CheY-like chemotaxis protein
MSIPVVMLTTSQAPGVERSCDLQASAFIRKPADFQQLADAVRPIGHFYLTLVTLPR